MHLESSFISKSKNSVNNLTFKKIPHCTTLFALKSSLALSLILAFTGTALGQTNQNNNAASNTAARAGSQTTASSLSSIITSTMNNAGVFRYRFGNNQNQPPLPSTASRTPDNSNPDALAEGLAAGDFGNWSAWATPVVSTYNNNIQPYTSKGTVVIGMAGVEYNYEEILTSGVSVAVNDTNSTTTYNNGTYKTVGVTVSPYAVYQLNDYLTLNSSVGVGGSNPNINVAGVNGTTHYNSLFGVIGISNNTQLGNFLLQPKLSYTYYIDKLASYTNGAGQYNAAYNTYLGQTQVGAQISYNTRLGFQPFIAAYEFINTWNSNQLAITPPSVYPSTYRLVAGINASKGAFYGTVGYQIERSVSQFRIYGGILF